MTTTTFDSLGYFEKLKSAGMPEAQAKVQAEAMREQAEAHAKALQQAMEKYEEANRKDLSTKGDIQDVRIEMKAMELRLLKWQIGIGFALVVIMAKGFGWLGF